MIKIKIFLGILLFFFSLLINAAIIDSDDHSYLTDTVSGLDWLDVTASISMSYYSVYVYGTYGGFNGWRYASGKEFNSLIINSGGIVSIDYNFNLQQETLNVSIIDSLQDLLGITKTNNLGVEYTKGLLSDSTADGSHYTAMLINDDRELSILDSSVARATTYYRSTGYDDLGSFLVRETSYIPAPVPSVPEPSIILLMTTGLVGLGLAKRKSKERDNRRA